MPILCRIEGCNQSSDTNSALLFHRFPKDSEIRQQWLFIIISNNLARGGEIREESKICSSHFRKDDYNVQYGRRVLKPYAIPTIFPDITIPVTTIGIPDEIFTDSDKKVKYFVGHQDLIDKISRGNGEVEGTLRQLILNTVVENRKQELSEVTDNIKFPTFSDGLEKDPLNLMNPTQATSKAPLENDDHVAEFDHEENIDDEDDVIMETNDTETTLQTVVSPAVSVRKQRNSYKRLKDCKLLSDFSVDDMQEAQKAEKYFNISSVAIVKQREIIQTLRTKVETLTKDLNNHKVQLCKHLLAAKRNSFAVQAQQPKPTIVTTIKNEPKRETSQQFYILPKATTSAAPQAGTSAAKFNLANLKKVEPNKNVKMVRVFKTGTTTSIPSPVVKRFKSDKGDEY